MERSHLPTLMKVKPDDGVLTITIPLSAFAWALKSKESMMYLRKSASEGKKGERERKRARERDSLLYNSIKFRLLIYIISFLLIIKLHYLSLTCFSLIKSLTERMMSFNF